MDLINAFDKFVAWWLHLEETVDEFLMELDHLALLAGEQLLKQWMACMFMSGLLQHVKWFLWTSSRMNTMSLEQLLTQSQAIVIKDKEPEESIATSAQQACIDTEVLPTNMCRGDIIRVRCSGLNHMVKDCMHECLEETDDQAHRSFCKVGSF